MAHFTLDETDRYLLTLLQANARTPTAELARILKLARTTVVARMARLEREGVVAGYGVRMGQQLEAAAVRAYCGLTVGPKAGAHVMRELARLPEIEEVSAVSGQFDYLVLLSCQSHQQLDTLLDQIGHIEGVNQTHTSIVLSRRLDRRSAVNAA